MELFHSRLHKSLSTLIKMVAFSILYTLSFEEIDYRNVYELHLEITNKSINLHPHKKKKGLNREYLKQKIK